jgi:hypothetical protein
MAIEAADVKFVKSATITDTGSNGGRSSVSPVVGGAMNNLFPLVTSQERAAGIERWRKLFWQNRSADIPAESAEKVSAYITNRSVAGDRQYIAKGTARDTQANITAGNPLLVGCGKLSVSLSGGETSVSAVFESNEPGFTPGGYLYIGNHYKAGQNIAEGVKAGDSVLLVAGTWQKADYTEDITYPKGRYLGDSEVETEDSGTSEYILLPTGLTENESIGTGDATTTPTLSALANITNGVNAFDDYRPVITVTVSGSPQTVTVNADGSCSGFCTAGQLNMTTGAWTTPVTFTQAPDNGTDITCSYYDMFWSWSGNTCTITTSAQVANPYSNTESYIAGCLPETDTAVASYEDFTDANGLYDIDTVPIQCHNDGAVEDDWTLTFTSTTAFACAGLFSGSVGTGNISNNFAPINPATGTPYFTIKNTGWQGSPSAGKQITFRTHIGEYPIWAKQIVPAGTDAVSANAVGIKVVSQ